MNSNLKRSESSITHIKSKIKLVFLGDQSTGKTSILLRFMHDKFQIGQGATVGIDFMAKNLTINNFHLRLQLWDTAGQQRFRSLIPSYLKDAGLAIIVFDVASRRSFENIRQWIDLCNQNKKQKSVVVLVGNKVDLEGERVVSFDEASQLAKTEDILYFEVSAKSNYGIDDMFNKATQKYIKDNFANTFTEDVDTSQKDVSKVIDKSVKNIELDKKPIMGGPSSQKKSCC